MIPAFRAYFSELYNGRSPFPWQERLLQQIAEEGWPKVIDLPTSVGKTSSIDVAIFALSAGLPTPRRIFFVVDRRIIVDDTYLRYCNCAKKLLEAKGGALAEVATALRSIAGVGPNESPLDVHQLRGGIYRDQSWVRSVLQPTLITSTVDQVGSRLLFRGYGVSPNTWPIHASLVANDALIFLDEAHCSRAFSQTLQAIHKYRSSAWCKEYINLPFEVVEMTATPAPERSQRVFHLDHQDREDTLLRQRLTTSKPVTLHPISAKPDDNDAVAKALVTQTLQLMQSGVGSRHAIIANRIATARRAATILQGHFAKHSVDGNHSVTLVIGRMRPLDRDDQRRELDRFGTDIDREQDSGLHVLVSTQCIEVGADFDFDTIVTESASIDALLQRFGRLDRLGSRKGAARGAIVMPAKAFGAKLPDPIYGRALEDTWIWLEEQATNDLVDFGLESPASQTLTIPQRVRQLPVEQSEQLKRVGESSPTLLPSHLDTLCQTSPRPHVEPDVSLFLHGPESGVPDVQVVWRADLDWPNSGSVSNDSVWANRWKELISLCPPSSSEAMAVRFGAIRSWAEALPFLTSKNNRVGDRQQSLRKDEESITAFETDDADLEGIPDSEHPSDREQPSSRGIFPALIWRGKDSLVVDLANNNDLRRVRPGDTLVVPCNYPGWQMLGHIPPSGLTEQWTPIDFGDRASLQSRRRPLLRLHASLLQEWPSDDENDAPKALQRLLSKPEELDADDVIDALSIYASEAELPPWLSSQIKAIATRKREGTVDKKPRLILHPSGSGVILMGRTGTSSIAEDSGDDESSFQEPVSLADHLHAVRDAAESVATRLLARYPAVFREAAILHDVGKVDIRFQALLRGGDVLAATLSPKPLAKGDQLLSVAFTKARQDACLPEGFRHELASLHFAENALASSPDKHHDLLLHLIASHHGRCRPFAPVIFDTEPETLVWNSQKISSEQRAAYAPHRLDSGVPRRFWKLTRQYGWWGLAFMEAAFRISDWSVSATPTALQKSAQEEN